MDGLIVVLLIIIGLAAKSSKKKKQAQQRARQAGFDEAAALERDGAKPSPAARVQDVLEDMGEEAAKQLKIPYSKEDWAKLVQEKVGPVAVNAKQRAANAARRSGDPSLISQMEPKQAPKVQAASPEGQKFQTLTAQRLDAQRLRPDVQHLEGESRREHEAHKQRIAAEEALLHREREELKELRNVNLTKLRSAVGMSEVLGKPVALRGRR